MFKRGDLIMYRSCRGRVTQAGHDGTWAVIHIDGAKAGKKVPTGELTPWVEPEEPEEPPVLQIERADFAQVRPLCDHCRFGTALCCPYMGCLDIIIGIAGAGAKVVACQLSGASGLSFKVIECPMCQRGELPTMGRVHGA